jgi:hypothetical protein
MISRLGNWAKTLSYQTRIIWHIALVPRSCGNAWDSERGCSGPDRVGHSLSGLIRRCDKRLGFHVQIAMNDRVRSLISILFWLLAIGLLVGVPLFH